MPTAQPDHDDQPPAALRARAGRHRPRRGDEFAVIRTDITGGASEIMALATRLCDAIKAPYDINGHAVVAETSVGISIAPDDAHSVGDVLKNADMALYRAKAEGRGSIRFFEPEMDARIKARRKLELALRRALAAGEFELHYQPLVDLNDGHITCCEARRARRERHQG